MKQDIIHIGLDVDDIQYHGSAFNKDTGEVIVFKSRPTLKIVQGPALFSGGDSTRG
jgi:hypothetical protein